MQQLSGLDASFLYFETPNSPMHIGFISIYDQASAPGGQVTLMGPIGDGLGLIHPVFSYCGQITISATSCRKLMPDPAFYAKCLQDSFDELTAATVGTSAVHETRTAPHPSDASKENRSG